MTDSEIIKALECCKTSNVYCYDCPLEDIAAIQNIEVCQDKLITEAYKLIDRQKAEIERLNIDLKAMRGAANPWKAEVQRICKREFDNIEVDIEAIKSEAVREFAEELMYNLDGDIEAYANAGHGLNVYEWLKSYLVSKGAIEMGCNDG